MKPSWRFPLLSHWFSGVVILVGCLVTPVYGQSAAAHRIELNQQGVTDSRIETLRKDLTEAIIHGASQSSVQRLIDRRRQLDNDLADQLAQADRRLADLQRDDDPIGNAEAIASLRRDRSLRWLNRIELAAMQSECFASGSSDAIVAAHETIRLIEEASTELPSRLADTAERRRPGDLISGEINRLLIEAHLQAGDGWAAQNVWSSRPQQDTPIHDPGKLAVAIRVDLANRRYDEAENALRAYYGSDPFNGANSIAMDLAMLEFLWSAPGHTEARVGDWMDTIEKRGGLLARRRAETWIARKRQTTATAMSNQSDPRLLRADGRYYYRAEKPLRSAVAFAKAAVQDDLPDRAIESAVSSAAILKKLSKPDAGKELLLQVAGRFSAQSQSAELVLQAASLANESEIGETDEVQRILQQCLQTWPLSDASRSARDWLIAIHLNANDELNAAAVATAVPVQQWDQTSRDRCRLLWCRAVLAADDPDSVLARMRQSFAEFNVSDADSASRSLRSEVFALLDDSISEATDIKDRAYRRLAEFRTTPNGGSRFELWDVFDTEPELLAALRWRLQRDIEQRPETAAAISLILLQQDGGSELDRMRWLIQSGQTVRAKQFMRTHMVGASNPARWLRVMASTLATTSRNDPRRESDLELASRLWTELADGLPAEDPVGVEARIEAIRCQFQSGARSEAIARAELMLLTHPPNDPGQRRWLQSLSE